MIEFHTPYLIPMVFLFLWSCVAFAVGNIFSELRRMSMADDISPVLRWLMLIVPSAIGIFVILWWPTTYVSG